VRFETPLQALKLLLPALIPSWNFFDVIAPSPRIEYALLASPAAVGDWREFRPRPAQVSPLAMACRMFWNPAWNETLFLVSCAERLTSEPTDHSEDEIFKRIAAELRPEETTDTPWLNFQLVFLSRPSQAKQADVIEREVLYRPAPRKLSDIR
jgi:hypothetical protein